MHDDGVRIQPQANPRVVGTLRAHPYKHFWLDLEAPTVEELGWLQEEFNLHPLAVEECDHTGVRPKLEEYPEHLYLVLHGINHNAGAERLDMLEFKMFLWPQHLITVHNRPSSSVRQAQERLARDPHWLEGGGDVILHSIVDAVIDHYVPVLNELEDQVEQIEERVLQSYTEGILEEMLALRRQFQALHRVVGLQCDLLNSLATRRYPEISEDMAAYFRDVHDHLLRLNDTVETNREALLGVLQTHLSVVSNRMNQVMKVLSLVATVTLPLTLLTGLFGINLERLPGSQWPHTFWALVGVMVVLSGVTFWCFRRMKWL
jgi:magnesium transporter